LFSVLSDDKFQIDSCTGEITVHGKFDREKNEQYSLHVFAEVIDSTSTSRRKRAVGGKSIMYGTTLESKEYNIFKGF